MSIELHVFDFDGTLFRSPVPDTKQLARLGLRDRYGRLMQPTSERGGLGWFQSLRTLSPPVVPEAPDRNWYVQPVLNHLLQMVSEEPLLEDLPSASPPSSHQRHRYFFVLTGRVVRFEARVRELLSNAGLQPHHFEEISLKSTETYGTVKHKMEVFHRWICKYAPASVHYYEDRPDQGAQLLYCMQSVQEKALVKAAAAAGMAATASRFTATDGVQLEGNEGQLFGMDEGKIHRMKKNVATKAEALLARTQNHPLPAAFHFHLVLLEEPLVRSPPLPDSTVRELIKSLEEDSQLVSRG